MDKDLIKKIKELNKLTKSVLGDLKLERGRTACELIFKNEDTDEYKVMEYRLFLKQLEYKLKELQVVSKEVDKL